MDEAGLAHWPVMFMYPEAMQADSVEDVCEGDSLGEHLDLMYPPGGSGPPWDASGEYTRPRLELWYLSHAATPLTAAQLTQARPRPYC